MCVCVCACVRARARDVTSSNEQTGTFLIDPAGTGRAFPIRCGADGTTYLTSKFTGYSVYYSACGGSADGDCTPTCDDGCYLDGDESVCCDSGLARHISAKSDVGFFWVDTNDNLIPSAQLDALSAMDYDSSLRSSDQVWIFDATDQVIFYGGGWMDCCGCRGHKAACMHACIHHICRRVALLWWIGLDWIVVMTYGPTNVFVLWWQSGYELTVSFFGDEDDHVLETPSDWYVISGCTFLSISMSLTSAWTAASVAWLIG